MDLLTNGRPRVFRVEHTVGRLLYPMPEGMVLAFCVVVAHAVVVVMMVRWINGRMALFLDLIDSRSAGRVRRMVSVKVFGVIGLSTLTIFALGNVNIYLAMRVTRFAVTGDVNLNVIPVTVVMAIFFGVDSDLLSAILSTTWLTMVSVCLRVDLEIFLVAILPSDTR